MRKILAWLKFYFVLAWRCCLCPVGCLSSEKFSWDSQHGRDRATSGSNKIKFQSDQPYSYIMRKVWCISWNVNSNLHRFQCALYSISLLLSSWRYFNFKKSGVFMCFFATQNKYCGAFAKKSKFSTILENLKKFEVRSFILDKEADLEYCALHKFCIWY